MNAIVNKIKTARVMHHFLHGSPSRPPLPCPCPGLARLVTRKLQNWQRKSTNDAVPCSCVPWPFLIQNSRTCITVLWVNVKRKSSFTHRILTTTNKLCGMAHTARRLMIRAPMISAADSLGSRFGRCVIAPIAHRPQQYKV